MALRLQRAVTRQLTARRCNWRQHASARHAAATACDVVVADDVAPLFRPWRVGRYDLAHRIVMPPLTRQRAIDTFPQAAAAEYYSQRTTPGGLLIGEATCVSADGHGIVHGPRIDTKDHVAAWRPIAKAVKDKGGVFFLQIWHGGRASHPDFDPEGRQPVSSSTTPISLEYKIRTPKGGPFPYPPARALETHEIPAMVQKFVLAAQNAIQAGFDGVELHGGTGYLIDQFTKDAVNKRADAYGGPIENRTRFALEVVQAVADAIGADRTGIRLSPFQQYMEATDSTPYATFTYLLERLNPLGLAYVHMVEPRSQLTSAGSRQLDSWKDSLLPFKTVCKAPFIGAGGHTLESGAEAVRSGHLDAVGYGRLFVANPDLVLRFSRKAPLNPYERSTFYSQGLEGYTDYPTQQQQQQQQAST